MNVNFFVFGGRNGDNLSSCEKMQLSDQRWTQINSMNYPRSYFTPCQFRSLLYLASAYDDHKKVETFNAETETFAEPPVSLPPQHPTVTQWPSLLMGSCVS